MTVTRSNLLKETEERSKNDREMRNLYQSAGTLRHVHDGLRDTDDTGGQTSRERRPSSDAGRQCAGRVLGEPARGIERETCRIPQEDDGSPENREWLVSCSEAPSRSRKRAGRRYFMMARELD